MGSGHAHWLHAVSSLQRTGVQPELLGLLCRVRAFCLGVPLIRGGISVATQRSCSRDFVVYARQCVGARRLLCRRHDFELHILLHRTHRSFNRDYGVLGHGGMALRETKLKAYG